MYNPEEIVEAQDALISQLTRELCDARAEVKRLNARIALVNNYRWGRDGALYTLEVWGHRHNYTCSRRQGANGKWHLAYLCVDGEWRHPRSPVDNQWPSYESIMSELVRQCVGPDEGEGEHGTQNS